MEARATFHHLSTFQGPREPAAGDCEEPRKLPFLSCESRLLYSCKPGPQPLTSQLISPGQCSDCRACPLHVGSPGPALVQRGWSISAKEGGDPLEAPFSYGSPSPAPWGGWGPGGAGGLSELSEGAQRYCPRVAGRRALLTAPSVRSAGRLRREGQAAVCLPFAACISEQLFRWEAPGLSLWASSSP